MSGITAIVLAGGPPDEVAALQPGAPNKAFVEIAGKTLAQRTIEGLRSSDEIGRIIVVAPEIAHTLPALAGADECRVDGVRITESLRSGLRDLPPDELVLVAASDLPILGWAAVTDFVRRAQTLDPDVGYGCLKKQTHLDKYPEVPHTWAPLRGGTYCGGGLIVVKPRALPHLEDFIERLGAARKNPLALAGIFGWRTLLKFAFRQLSIEDAEARASALLGAPVRAIVSPYAETAVNVDRVSDVALAEALVAAQSATMAYATPSFSPSTKMLLDLYQGLYDVAFIALHPFSNSDTQTSVTWTKTRDDLGFGSYAELARAIMDGTSRPEYPTDHQRSLRLQDYAERFGGWPIEDAIAPELQRPLAELYRDCGITAAEVRDDVGERVEMRSVSDLFEPTAWTSLGVPRVSRIVDVDRSLFAFCEFDMHYTVIVAKRERLGDIKLEDRFEGFWATPETPSYWWREA